jgi:GA-binding protein transcription factor alpha
MYFLLKERLKIPIDPKDWSETHVKHWLQWAVRQFNLISLRLADWNITGAQLCNLTMEEFQAKVPLDPGDVFWTHFELLRKCRFVGTLIKRRPNFFVT